MPDATPFKFLFVTAVEARQLKNVQVGTKSKLLLNYVKSLCLVRTAEIAEELWNCQAPPDLPLPHQEQTV